MNKVKLALGIGAAAFITAATIFVGSNLNNVVTPIGVTTPITEEARFVWAGDLLPTLPAELIELAVEEEIIEETENTPVVNTVYYSNSNYMKKPDSNAASTGAANIQAIKEKEENANKKAEAEEAQKEAAESTLEIVVKNPETSVKEEISIEESIDEIEEEIFSETEKEENSKTEEPEISGESTVPTEKEPDVVIGSDGSIVNEDSSKDEEEEVVIDMGIISFDSSETTLISGEEIPESVEETNENIEATEETLIVEEVAVEETIEIDNEEVVLDEVIDTVEETAAIEETTETTAVAVVVEEVTETVAEEIAVEEVANTVEETVAVEETTETTTEAVVVEEVTETVAEEIAVEETTNTVEETAAVEETTEMPTEVVVVEEVTETVAEETAVNAEETIEVITDESISDVIIVVN